MTIVRFLRLLMYMYYFLSRCQYGSHRWTALYRVELSWHNTSSRTGEDDANIIVLTVPHWCNNILKKYQKNMLIRVSYFRIDSMPS